jgi:RNA polymerase sigma-70 factor, ECF subfamily
MASSTDAEQRHLLLLDAARADHDDAFRVLVEPHRRELHAHCSRMLGSVHDADDAYQDAMVRAWRGLSGLIDGMRLRPWLYQIATNTCLDAIRRRSKRALPIDCGRAADDNDASGEPISPLGDADRFAAPEARYEQREAVERACIAALEYLPGRQRTVLILREVLGFSAREVAELVETTVPSVNSALQRARWNLKQRTLQQGRQATPRALGDERTRNLVARFTDAFVTGDVGTILAVLAQDTRCARYGATASTRVDA